MNAPPSIAIVGGGLAGLAASVAAVRRGWRVELFDNASQLGGRAGSFVDTTTGHRIDRCQHVAMGCCNQFLEFCREIQVDDCFERQSTLHFIGPDAVQHDFASSRWLPRPLHLLPGLMRLDYLTLRERWHIVRAMRQLVRPSRSHFFWRRRPKPTADSHEHAADSLKMLNAIGRNVPFTDDETAGAWLRRHGQSHRAIERFWSVVLVSALSETVDRASLAAARKVFCDGFLASRTASDLILPKRPLGEIFHDRASKWLADRGVVFHGATPVHQIEGDRRRVAGIRLADGVRRAFDYVVATVSWHNIRDLFADELLAAMPELAGIEHIEPAGITAVHLWFDRPITQLPHAVLVGRLCQWVFAWPDGRCQVVISASDRLPKRTHEGLVADVCRELQAIWPTAREANLLHSRVVSQPLAVFSVMPGLERWRPTQQTPVENLALAGDWTATGWPATMEGAVRSGFQAIQGLSGPRA